MTLKSSLAQKIPCGLVTILDIFWVIHVIRSWFPIKGLHNPRLYITMVGVVAAQVAKIVFFVKLWLQEKQMVRLPKLIVTIEHYAHDKLYNRKMSKLVRFGIFMISLSYVVVGIITFGRIYGYDSHYEVHGYRQWWLDMINAGRKIFYLGDDSSSIGEAYWSDILVGVLAALGLLHRYLNLY